MSGVTNFPGALDDDSSMYDVTDNVTQIIAAHHNNLKQAVKAVEAKLGIDGGSVATSLDYLMRNPTSGHRHSGATGQGRRISHGDLLDTATGNPHSMYTPLSPTSGLVVPTYLGASSIPTGIRFLANDQLWRNINPTQFNFPSYAATSNLFPAADGVWRAPAGGGGGGGSGAAHPLDAYTMDATYGDDFSAASLDAKWTRRTIVSGDEAYQQGISGSFLRVLPGAHGVAGAGYTQACSVDGTYAMKFIARNWPVCAFGLAFLDSAGTGLVLQYYNGPFAYLLLDLTTYTSYGGNFVTAGFPAGLSVNQSVVPVDPAGAQIPVWLKVRKSGTSYYPSFSTDGEIWSPEGTARVWTGTLNRIAMLIGPLGSVNGISSLGYVDVDWFNKIA